MKSTLFLTVLGIVVLVIGLAIGNSYPFTGGRGLVPSNLLQEKSELEDRVQNLEDRVGQLESILFATSRLAMDDAKRRLADAERQLKDSEALFLRGMITQAQLLNDRTLVQIARQELELADFRNNQQKAATELEVIQARQRLQEAEQNLDYQMRLFAKGFVTDRQIQNSKVRKQSAKRALQIAEQRLKFAEKAFIENVPKRDEKEDGKK